MIDDVHNQTLFDEPGRYHRQMLLPGIGPAGQARLGAAHVCIVGCGALGTVIADTLARAGVGTLTIVDRDIVEITNLQRQVLFDEDDVAEGRPKAIAAARAIASINRHVTVRPFVEDFNHANAVSVADGANLLLDGLDNFATRYLLNDLAVKTGRPYLYGGAVGTTGAAMVVLPHGAARTAPAGGAVTWNDDDATPCLRCLFPEAPPAGSTPTCDTAGVLAPAVAQVAAHQSTQAIKLLVGALDQVDRRLHSFDIWLNERTAFDIAGARRTGDDPCPCCVQGSFEYLDGAHAPSAITLCGREAVQIAPPGDRDIDLQAMALALSAHGPVKANEHLLRTTLAGETGAAETPVELTVFADGRAIVKGVTSPERAQTIYDRYVGR